MAGAANKTNVLNQFHDMVPVKAKVSFMDPATGQKVKVKIEKPKRGFWRWGSMKRRKHKRAHVEDLTRDEVYEDNQSYINDRRNINTQINHGERAEKREETAFESIAYLNPNSYCNEDFEAYEAIGDDTQRQAGTEMEYCNEPVCESYPSMESNCSASGTSGEDSFGNEVDEIYKKLTRRRISAGYANVPTERQEPLYSKI